MPTEKPILNFVVENELLKRIDDFRFENRINTRSETIRQLIEAGLTATKSKSKKK